MKFKASDVFVVGGGPAGLAAAIAARRKGFRVTLADSREPPVDKACGEGLMPDGVAAGARLGLHLKTEDCFSFRGIRFHGEGVTVAADFPFGPGLGIRRTTLQKKLQEQAEELGVDLHWGCPITSLDAIDARWIVGADGTASQVRSWSGLGASRRDTHRYGFRRHYRIAPWSDHVEIHWGDGCQVYVTPVARNEISVALLSLDSKLRVNDGLRQFPALDARLKDVPESSTERGAVTASRRLRRVTRGNIALLGDASGSVDAITGDGISLGFHHALALADALESGNLRSYETAHRRLARRPRFMANMMLTLDQRHWLRQRVLPALASHPDLFAGLLAMHVGAARTSEFAANCLTLGWKIVRA